MTSPFVVVLTDRTACPGGLGGLADVCAAAVDAGASRVLVREKDLDAAARVALTRSVVAAVGGASVLVAVGARPSAEELRAWAGLGVAGVHLASDAGDCGPAPSGALPWGRSCHNAGDVARAVAAGASWVTVSPVAATPTKPGYGPALGVDGLAALVAVARSGTDARPSPPPAVLALGGVTPANAAACLRAGADGLSVLGSVMSAPDPRVAVRDLLDAVHRQETR